MRGKRRARPLPPLPPLPSAAPRPLTSGRAARDPAGANRLRPERLRRQRQWVALSPLTASSRGGGARGDTTHTETHTHTQTEAHTYTHTHTRKPARATHAHTSAPAPRPRAGTHAPTYMHTRARRRPLSRTRPGGKEGAAAGRPAAPRRAPAAAFCLQPPPGAGRGCGVAGAARGPAAGRRGKFEFGF